MVGHFRFEIISESCLEHLLFIAQQLVVKIHPVWFGTFKLEA